MVHVINHTEELSEMNEWKPIETAPKDGHFLAYKKGISCFVACILDSDHPDCDVANGVHDAWEHSFVDGVTHWMPLPEPPK